VHSYRSAGDYSRALELGEQTLVFARRIGHPSIESTALGLIGRVYEDQGNDRKALAYYEQRLTFARQIGDLSIESEALFDSADFYKAKAMLKERAQCAHSRS